jgi:tRNA pseudouridine38-40 synthase
MVIFKDFSLPLHSFLDNILRKKYDKMRYFIYLSYNGKNYCGWQAQHNGKSIQGELQKALSTILKFDINVVGAGRTDAGVHAKLMAAHFDYDDNIDFKIFIRHLNGFLPKDIAIHKILRVKDDAHARFDAVKRTYEYHINQTKNPFYNGLAYNFYRDLDFEKMNLAAEYLLGYQDFTSFSKLHTEVKTNYCTVFRAEWQQRGDIWVFTIQANRFLRNMVRAVVGTLLLVGENKISTGVFRQIIEQKERSKAGASVAAEGLYLVDVEYNSEIFEL